MKLNYSHTDMRPSSHKTTLFSITRLSLCFQQLVMSFPREQSLSVTQYFSYVTAFVFVSCLTNKPRLSPEELHAHSPALTLLQQLCEVLHSDVHAYAYACTHRV